MSSGRAWDPSPDRVGQIFASSNEVVESARWTVAAAALRRGWSQEELVDVLEVLGLAAWQFDDAC